ncbi:MAG: hypothetical protein QGH40_14825 [bacterium]|nr:hypothetical protein [bacterium]
MRAGREVFGIIGKTVQIFIMTVFLTFFLPALPGSDWGAEDNTISQGDDSEAVFEQWRSPDSFEVDFSDSKPLPGETDLTPLELSPYQEPYQPVKTTTKEPPKKRKQPEYETDDSQSELDAQFTDYFKDLLMQQIESGSLYFEQKFDDEFSTADESDGWDKKTSLELNLKIAPEVNWLNDKGLPPDRTRNLNDLDTFQLEPDRYDLWDRPLGTKPDLTESELEEKDNIFELFWRPEEYRDEETQYPEDD